MIQLLPGETFHSHVHDMEDTCARYHCWWHQVDEANTGFRVCGECLHTFTSAKQLRRDHRREVISTLPYNWLVKLWLYATVRVDKISCCPFCAHDF